MNIFRRFIPSKHFQLEVYTARLPHLSQHFSFVRRNGTSMTESNQHSDSDLPVEGLVNPYQKDRRCCVLCKYKVKVDYKNPRLLSQFISPFTGKIYEQNITGLCKKQQELVELEVTRSRAAGFLAHMLKKVEYLKDPKLYDPNRPIRPHKY